MIKGGWVNLQQGKVIENISSAIALLILVRCTDYRLEAGGGRQEAGGIYLIVLRKAVY
jgi:hypothetical protein